MSLMFAFLLSVRLVVFYICFIRFCLLSLFCLLFLLFGFADIGALCEFVQKTGPKPTPVLMACVRQDHFQGNEDTWGTCVRSVLCHHTLLFMT